MDPSQEAVAQPDEGQGAAPEPQAPYAEYLNQIPEEYRETVEPAFRKWDADVTRRFQEQSEFRKTWEPFRETGVHHRSPDEVQWAIQFYDAAANNPEAVAQWYQEYAAQHGLNAAQAPAAPAAPEPDPFSFDEFAAPDQTAAFQKMLEQQLSPLTSEIRQLAEWRAAQEQQVREAEAERMIRSQLDQIKAEHPDVYNEEAIAGLLPKYMATDPQHAVARAFEDWRGIYGQIQRDTLQAKVDNARPQETGGVPNGAPDPIRTLADASRIALEQLRGSRAA